MSGHRDGEIALLRGFLEEALAGQRPQPDGPDPHTLRTLPESWVQALELGWHLIALPEADGGAGDSASALVVLAEALGRQTVFIPVLETALTRWFLHRAGHPQPAPKEILTLALVQPAADRGTESLLVSAAVENVPWARFADRLLLVGRVGGQEEAGLLVAIDAGRADGVEVKPGANLAGEPRDTVILERAAASAIGLSTGAFEELEAYGALVSAAATLGAMDRARRLTRAHACTRSQFNRSLSRFQLVGEHLARIACLVEVARAVVADAVAGHDHQERALQRAAVAKAWTARAAGEVAERAHQVHAAIGVTREHELHLATRRLWSWRDDWGSESYWDACVGRAAIDGGEAAAWDLVTV